MKTLPPTYSTTKPQTVPLNKVYVHVGHEKIYFGRGGEVERGGLVREASSDFGPQRDPTERLDWIQKQVAQFDPSLFRDPLHLSKDENGEYADTDGGGRALMAHILGHPTIEAFVKEGQTPEDMAIEFRRFAGSRVPLKAVQLFLTYVAERSLRHVSILRALQPFYTVRQNGIDAISSVAALYAVYDYAAGAPEDKNSPNYAGIELIQRTSAECFMAWSPTYEVVEDKRILTRKGRDVSGNMFVAVAEVLQALPEGYDEKRLRRWLASHTPEDISDAAQQDINEIAMHSAVRAPRVALKTLSLDMALPMAMVITRGYNKGLKKPSQISVDAMADSELARNYAKTRQSKHVR